MDPAKKQLVIEALEELRPLTAYGVPGSRDAEQARLRHVLDAALALLREERQSEDAKDAQRYRDAIVWALGAGDDFPLRENGQGAYWWRMELQKRAGLHWNGEAFVDAALSAPKEPKP